MIKALKNKYALSNEGDKRPAERNYLFRTGKYQSYVSGYSAGNRP